MQSADHFFCHEWNILELLLEELEQGSDTMDKLLCVTRNPDLTATVCWFQKLALLLIQQQ